MENMLTEKREYFQMEIARLDKMIAERIEELSDNTALVDSKSNEYTAILSQIMMAENKIAQAEIKAKQVLDNQEVQISKIKERFQSWKLTQLDQVAKLKLKGKIENIDRAGLKDILDV
jgi:predicted patatin/cPLA2 family phospholipase